MTHDNPVFDVPTTAQRSISLVEHQRLATSGARTALPFDLDDATWLIVPHLAEDKGLRKSRIVLDLTPGNIITTPRTDMMHVVTEFGMANHKGRSVAERAKLMIGLAHPDFREDLERQAFEHGLIRRGG